jgi:aspartyl-tRNA(Asn)/glutamyl-tRNA(Gln) amidotransferase subunit A
MTEAWPTVIELAESVRSGQTKAVELLDRALAAIEADNEPLNAFVHVDADLARRSAEAVDAKVAAGEDPGPLAGVPFGIKDLEDCAGMPTSNGSLLFKGRPPVEQDSVHVGRLRAAGAVPVGKTAAPEFGTLNFTKTRAWGVTRNPWDTNQTPGGSSGGSAAAVAAGIVPLATASDGGGSTRIPASFSGLVGIKASFGRIPNPGPNASQTTSLGALVTTVTDAARHLDIAAGPDDRDRTTLPSSTLSYEDAVESLNVEGMRARWSLDLGFAVVDPEVAVLVEDAALKLIAAAGLQGDNEPVHLTDPVKTWLSCGAADLWLELDEDMWPAVADDVTYYSRSVLEETADMTVPHFARTYKRRAQLEADAAAVFADVDILLTPTTAVPAFVAEGPPPDTIAGQKVHLAMSTPFTMLANLCWNPSISVPAGLTSAGLPVGLQITTRRHRDEVALRLARILEQSRPWPRVAGPISTQ